MVQTQTATITSKRQLTIPASIFRQAGFKKGQKVLVSIRKGKMEIQPSLDLIEELSGSVKIPKEYKGLTVEQIIQKAKKEYFKRK